MEKEIKITRRSLKKSLKELRKKSLESNSTQTKEVTINRNSVQYLKYRDMAIEFIKQRYTNITSIYAQYYPKAGKASLAGEASRLLTNAKFQLALEDAWQIIKIDDLDIARAVKQTLYDISIKGKKEADRIAAASWLGKCESMFTDRTENNTNLVIKPEEVSELQRIRGSLFSITN